MRRMVLFAAVVIGGCGGTGLDEAVTDTGGFGDIVIPEDTGPPDAGPDTGPDVEAMAPCDGVTLTISPAAPTTLDAVEATLQGGQGNYAIRWFSLAGAQPSYTADGALLSATKTMKGVTYQAVAEAQEAGICSKVTAEVTVINSPPSVSQVTVTPSAAFAGQTLTCGFELAHWADPDDTDPKTPKVQWFAGQSELPGGTDTTISSGFKKGDEVWCRMTPFDGEAEGPPVDSNTIPILNAAPEISALTTVCEPGEPVSCTAKASDPDGTLTALEIDWLTGPGDCNTGTVLTDNQPGIPGVSASVLQAQVAKGQKVFCCATPVDSDDSGLTGSTVKGDDCVVPNQPPMVSGALVTNLIGGPVAFGDTAVCAAQASDPDNDSISIDCSWFINGEDVGGPSCELTGAFAKNDSVCCQFVVSDGISTVESEAKVCQKVADTAPTVSEVSISPPGGDHCAPFQCTGLGADVDGDDVALTVSWKVDGELFAGVPTPAPGQVVACTVTPVSDGLAGPSAVAEVTATNTPPSVQLVVVEATDEPALSSSELTCAPSGFTDVDSCDEATWTYQWFVNGKEVDGEDGAVLAKGSYGKQNVVSCVATPGDGWESGQPVPSSVKVIQNSPPQIDLVTVSPVVGNDNTEFTCETTGGDADGDLITWVYQWFVNGQKAATLSGKSVTGVPFEGVEAELTCAAQAFDAQSAGGLVASSNKALLFNVPPQVISVALTPPEADTTVPLQCAGTVIDGDGDEVEAQFEWFRVAPEGPKLIQDQENATLPAAATAHFDTIYCSITPYDGKVSGAAQISNNVTIANSAPSLKKVTIVPQAGTPQTPFTCAVIGYADADEDPPKIQYAWTANDQVLAGALTGDIVPSDFGAKAGDVLACVATPNDGFVSGAKLAATATVDLVTCQPGIDGLPCDDEDPCTTDDACLVGVCVGPPADCDDLNPCTSDQCVDEIGCVNTSVVEGQDCDDENVCTINDGCSGGKCVGGAPFDCNDDNVCTTDSCSDAKGCQYAPAPGDCDDGVCVQGVCCIPDCGIKECGNDGCGGSCGTCDGGDTCLDPPGQCFGDLTDATIVVPPGAFMMGCRPDDTDCKPTEKPYHTVTLSPYLVDATEVTVLRYGECVDDLACAAPDGSSGGCLFGKPGTDALPVNCVTWDDAAAYCAYRDKRLCTEAEWERAARGVDGQLYPWGDLEASCALAIMKDGTQVGCGLLTPGAAGSILSAHSPIGALDMAGNVSEWVADWYGSGYYVSSPKNDPKGPAVSQTKAHRGGGYESAPADVRVSARHFLQPGSTSVNLGFRCCQDYTP